MEHYKYTVRRQAQPRPTPKDWERGMTQALEPVFSQKTCPDRDRVFSVLGKEETQIQQENKSMLYPLVLEQAYKSLTGELRLGYDQDMSRPANARKEDAEAFGASVGSWPAFPDSASALGKLKKLGLRLCILSNVNVDSFAESRKKLETEGGEFDAVYTAEDIGSYKPDLRNFRFALQRLEEDFDIKPKEVLVVANSLYHDVQPGHKMALKAAHIQRGSNIMGVVGHDAKPDWQFNSMEEFAEEMRRQKED